jgi:Fic family protein
MLFGVDDNNDRLFLTHLSTFSQILDPHSSLNSFRERKTKTKTRTKAKNHMSVLREIQEDALQTRPLTHHF